MAERASALGGAAAGRRLRIREVAHGSLVQISAFHGRAPAAAEALGQTLGLRPPLNVGETAARGDQVMLCVGPGRWWLVGDGHVPALDPTLGAVVDQSHGRTVIEVEGANLRDLLAKGCAIDIERSSFPSGACAATRLGHFAVVLHARTEERIDVHVARSYAHSLWSWLEDAALEFESGTGLRG